MFCKPSRNICLVRAAGHRSAAVRFTASRYTGFSPLAMTELGKCWTLVVNVTAEP